MLGDLSSSQISASDLAGPLQPLGRKAITGSLVPEILSVSLQSPKLCMLVGWVALRNDRKEISRNTCRDLSARSRMKALFMRRKSIIENVLKLQPKGLVK